MAKQISMNLGKDIKLEIKYYPDFKNLSIVLNDSVRFDYKVDLLKGEKLLLDIATESEIIVPITLETPFNHSPSKEY